jgi:hypothetical protein
LVGAQTADQRLDRLRLIAGRLERASELKLHEKRGWRLEAGD